MSTKSPAEPAGDGVRKPPRVEIPRATPAGLAALVVGAVWLIHTTAIDRLEVTKLAVALLAASAATLLVDRWGRLEPEAGAEPATSAAPVLGLVGLCLLGGTLLFGDFVGARVEGWAPWVAGGLVFALVRRSPTRRVGGLLSIGAGALALLGVGQALGLEWFNGGGAAFQGRPVLGTLGNPDLFGVCLAGALPFAVVRARHLWFSVLAVLILAAIAASGSRTAWVMTLPGLVVAVRQLPTRRAALLGLAGLAVVGVVALSVGRVDLESRLADLGDAEGTAAGRLYLWRVNAGLLAGAGPLGGGPGAFQRVWPWVQGDYLAGHSDEIGFYSDLRHAHADPVEIAVDWGWIGLLFAAWWAWRLLRPRPPRRPDEAAEAAAARASLIALLLGGLAHPVLFQTPSLLLAAAAAGVLAPGGRAGPRHRLWRVAALVGLVLTLFWVGRRVVSEVARTDGLRAEIAGELEAARVDYRRASEIDPENPLAHWMVARSLLRSDPEAALRAAEAAARHLPTAAVYALRALAAEAADQPALAAESRAIVERLRPR